MNNRYTLTSVAIVVGLILIPAPTEAQSINQLSSMLDQARTQLMEMLDSLNGGGQDVSEDATASETLTPDQNKTESDTDDSVVTTDQLDEKMQNLRELIRKQSEAQNDADDNTTYDAGSGLNLSGDNAFLVTQGANGIWNTNDSDDFYYSGGRVGIGTSSPSATLSVAGDISADSITATGTTNFEGLTTFESGYISQASSTVTGDFTADANATTTGAQQIGADLNVDGTTNLVGLGTFENGFVSQSSSTVADTFTASGLSTFESGFLSQASSTIGDGTQSGGLTVSGGATTTGDQLVQGTLTAEDTINADGDLITNTTGNDLKLEQGSNSDQLVLDTGGNVGVGTSNPENRLVVQDDNTTDTDLLNINSNSTNSGRKAGLSFKGQVNDGSLKTYSAIRTIFDNSLTSGYPSSLVFYTAKGGSLQEAMRIDSNGNIGINSTKPSNKLEIANGDISLTPSNSDFSSLKSIRGLTVSSDFNGLSGAPADFISFQTNGGTERMRITESGNVGLGTTSPTDDLAVSGDANVTGTTTLATDGGNVGVGSTRDPGYGLQLWEKSQRAITKIGDPDNLSAPTTGQDLKVELRHTDYGGFPSGSKAGEIGFVKNNTTNDDNDSYAGMRGIFDGPGGRPRLNFYIENFASSYGERVGFSLRQNGLLRANHGIKVEDGDLILNNNAYAGSTHLYSQAYNNSNRPTDLEMRWDGDKVGEYVFNATNDSNNYVTPALFDGDNGYVAFGGDFQPDASVDIRAQAGQTAPLLELQDNSNSVLASVDTDGALSLGTSSPAAQLDIQNATDTQPILTASDDQGNEKARITNSGNVGIGTTSPNYRLHVATSSDGAVAGFTDSNGTCTVDPTSTSLSCSSDRRLKDDISKLSSASVLNNIQKLSAVTYRWDSQEEGKQYGLIAQDVEDVYPEFVSEGPNGYKKLSYSSFIPVAIEGIKQLDLRLDQMEAGTTSVGRLTNDDSFVKKVATAVTDILKQGTQTFQTLVAQKRVRAPELCAGSTCVTENQLKQLLEEQGVAHNSHQTYESVTSTQQREEDSQGEESDEQDQQETDTASSTPNGEAATTTPQSDTSATSTAPQTNASSTNATSTPSTKESGEEVNTSTAATDDTDTGTSTQETSAEGDTNTNQPATSTPPTNSADDTQAKDEASTSTDSQ